MMFNLYGYWLFKLEMLKFLLLKKYVARSTRKFNILCGEAPATTMQQIQKSVVSYGIVKSYIYLVEKQKP